VVIGRVTDALVSCFMGEIGFLIVREGGTAGVGESLCPLSWRDVQVHDQTIRTELSGGLRRLPLDEQGRAIRFWDRRLRWLPAMTWRTTRPGIIAERSAPHGSDGFKSVNCPEPILRCMDQADSDMDLFAS